MKIPTRYYQSYVILGLSLLLSGCLVSAQGNPRGGDSVSPYPAPSEPGPPAHAKAYGYRAQYHYQYYPASSVYFDTGRGIYFYLDSNGSWRMTAHLPQSLQVHLGDSVTIEMETDKPYTRYPEHKKKYSHSHGKSKKHKWE